MKKISLLLAMAPLMLTACDGGPGGVFVDHPIDALTWQQARAPEVIGDDIEYVAGWYASDCPSGVQVSPDGGTVTFGAFHNVLSVDIDLPEPGFDHGFDGHEFVAASVDVQGQPTTLVSGEYMGTGDLYVLRPGAAQEREDRSLGNRVVARAQLARDGEPVTLSQNQNWRGCRLDWGGTQVQLDTTACEWGSDLAVDTDRGAAWVVSSTGMHRIIDGEVTTLAEHTGTTAVFEPVSGNVVYGGGWMPTSTAIQALDSSGAPVWTRDSNGTVLDIERLPDGVVVVLEQMTWGQVRLRFFDAETGAAARSPVRIEAWVSEMAASEDGRTIALLGSEVYAFRLLP